MIDSVAAKFIVAGNGSDVDDMAAIALDHARQSEAGKLQSRAQVDVDLLVDVEGIGTEDIARA
ncbi:hypothetical protein D3C87_2210410 [compost metagenome]